MEIIKITNLLMLSKLILQHFIMGIFISMEKVEFDENFIFNNVS